MLTENFIAATLTAAKRSQHVSSTLKDVDIFLYEYQPQSTFRHGYKRSSVQAQCLAISDTHIFAAQAHKAVINVYSREKGSHESTVPFPDRIRSIAYAKAAAILVIGTEEGKLVLWEIATGRLSTSAASHLQGVSHLCVTPGNDYILSGSDDATVFVWSLAKLVSFRTSDTSLGEEQAGNIPVVTFSNHRDSITGLTCGHSRPGTNFAVSASREGTCYMWHTETGEVLRTILLPTAPTCVVIDPVDRALYFGDDGGGVVFVDILSTSVQEHRTGQATGLIPLQLKEKDRWRPTTDLGEVHCLTLSWDGTALLSGHAKGIVVQWDVGKKRMASEVTNLAQPVTNIEMLRPIGLEKREQVAYTSSTVVKPKLEFSANAAARMSGVPVRYDFHASLTGVQRLRDEDLENDHLKAILSNGWPDSLLDSAIRALDIAGGDFGSIRESDLNEAKIGRLKEQVVDLEQRLVALQSLEERRNARKIARSTRRDEIGSKRRAAYFEAKRQGKDGDAAMKVWEGEEAKIDAEALADEMDVT